MAPIALKATGVGKVYQSRGRSRCRALEAVDLELQAGQALAVTGRSGAGKTTLARCLAGLDHFSEGNVWSHDAQPQLVFQDSPWSLNPRWTVADLIREPMLIQGCLDDSVPKRMEEVGLPFDLSTRFPRQLSGGQRRRVAIARALAVPRTQVLILDEPWAGLDPETAQRICDLLRTMQQQRSLGLIFISHDLTMLRGVANQIAVLDQGRLVELLPAEHFFAAAQHSVSRALLAAMLP